MGLLSWRSLGSRLCREGRVNSRREAWGRPREQTRHWSSSAYPVRLIVARPQNRCRGRATDNACAACEPRYSLFWSASFSSRCASFW